MILAALLDDNRQSSGKVPRLLSHLRTFVVESPEDRSHDLSKIRLDGNIF